MNTNKITIHTQNMNNPQSETIKMNNQDFSIGERVRIVDGIGKGCLGYVYGYSQLGSLKMYRVFSTGEMYILNENPTEYVYLQGCYSNELLEKTHGFCQPIKVLINLGLDLNRKTFYLTRNPNKKQIFMSYE